MKTIELAGFVQGVTAINEQHASNDRIRLMLERINKIVALRNEMRALSDVLKLVKQNGRDAEQVTAILKAQNRIVKELGEIEGAQE